MIIDSVHYSRKLSDGNYGNLELGMHAQVSDKEDPSEVAADLRSYVDHLIQAGTKQQDAYERMLEDLSETEARLAQKQRELERMAGQWAQARDFLEKHGVNVSSYDDVPF